MRKPLFFVVIFWSLVILPACQSRSLLPIPKGRIVFALQAVPSPYSDLNIYTINTDGFGAERLTNNPNQEFDPIWSPDGTQIVFVSNDGGGTQLYKMNADGSHQISLTPILDTIHMDENLFASSGEASPDWSPDGRKIIFTSYQHIKELDLESDRITDLLPDTQRGAYPKWSPDGKKIMFITVGNGQVITMNADGTDQQQINKSQPFSRLLDWSPDGRWVAVYDEEMLSIMRPDGSQLRGLTRQCELPYKTPSAAFSPDSQWLVMTCVYEKEYGIYVINLEEGVLRKLIYDLPVDYFHGIDWSQ